MTGNDCTGDARRTYISVSTKKNCVKVYARKTEVTNVVKKGKRRGRKGEPYVPFVPTYIHCDGLTV